MRQPDINFLAPDIVVLFGMNFTREFQTNPAGQAKMVVLASKLMKVINDSFVAQSYC